MNERIADYQKILRDGFWTKNQALVAMLGLCPLLAVTNNVVNGLGLGLATLLVLITSNLLVSSIRGIVPHEIRIPVFISIIAASVTALEMLINAYLHELYLVLGIFIPLIVTNCMILARADAFASRNPLDKSLVDAFGMGVGFLLVLVILGALRELLGQGTLFDQAHILLGDWGQNLTLQIVPKDYPGLLLAILPPGAFIALGFLLALMNVINARKVKRQTISIPLDALKKTDEAKA
jgi:electron transport complex protein RnfE